MRILFVTNEFPYPPDNGVRIVSHHAMRLMAERKHDIALAVLDGSNDTTSECSRARVADLCSGPVVYRRFRRGKPAISAFARGTVPMSVSRYYSRQFNEDLSQAVSRFAPDVVHYDTILMTQYRISDRQIGSVASINDSNTLALENCLRLGLYSGSRLLLAKHQIRASRRYESSAYSAFDRVHVVSDRDAAYLKQLNSEIRPVVISNGVSDRLFSIPADETRPADLLYLAPLVGANVSLLMQFLSTCWQAIRSACPELRLHVVGKIGQDCGPLKEFADAIGGVELHGYVDDAADVFRMCGISLVPIDKTCGILNKAIESMAAGLAVVSFQNTIDGIPHAHDGENCVAVESFAQMTPQIIGLATDSRKRTRIQRAARKMTTTHYRWSSRGPSFEDLYAGAVESANSE